MSDPGTTRTVQTGGVLSGGGGERDTSRVVVPDVADGWAIRDTSRVVAQGMRAEWIKLRSVPSSRWAVGAALASTVLLGLLVCASVDTSGAGPTCTPGAPGCGDEDVVLNSLSGVYAGQIAVVVLAVLAITTEHATGTLSSTFVANPRRLTVLASKAAVVAGAVFAVGLVASVGAFAVGQPILHGNGFTGSNGYPAVSLTDGPVARAVVGSALYLAVVALLSLGVGAVARRGVVAISTLLGLLYVPTMVALMVPGSLGDRLQQVMPMTAGLAIQRTVERPDSVPIGPWAGLGVATLWALAALVAAVWSTHTRDA